MSNKIDEYISAKLQACAINYDYYITKLFGDKHNINKELALAIQFSPITPEQQKNLTGNAHIISSIRNFITKFESELPEESLQNSRYAYKSCLYRLM